MACEDFIRQKTLTLNRTLNVLPVRASSVTVILQDKNNNNDDNNFFFVMNTKGMIML